MTDEPHPPRRPSAETLEQLGFRPQEPTHWLAPRRFVRTETHTLLAELFGGFTDRRETLAALDPRPAPVEDIDLSDRSELWLDVVADTGDGFAATYAIAWTLAQEHLAVEGCPSPLPAGSLLVFGGDEVYPVADDEVYRDKLVGPYQAALPWRAEGAVRDVVSIPGNHDWYDGLAAWSRRFCQQRWIGAWRTQQRRSYAAVRLPHHWWVWAMDIALAGLVDQPQLEYFDRMAGRAAELAAADGATARLVIVTAKPTWITAREGTGDDARLDPVLDHIESRLARANGLHVAAVLSGDDHYYARYTPEGDGPQRVTCGGGGAFLHPTDHIPDRLSVARRAWPGHERDEALALAVVEPTRERSRALRVRALLFGFRNGWFPLVTAFAYLVWLLPPPGRVVAVVAFFAVLAKLTKLPSMAGRALWGGVHTAAHVGVMVLAVALADALADGQASVWGRAVALFLAGAVVGPLVFGLYFLVAGTLAAANDNEAFAAIRVQDHKGFLRLHLSTDGRLVMHAIGIRDVPPRSAWRLDPSGPAEAPWFAPVDGRGPKAHLVDGPVDLG